MLKSIMQRERGKTTSLMCGYLFADQSKQKCPKHTQIVDHRLFRVHFGYPVNMLKGCIKVEINTLLFKD